jgi:hypothetical protein
MFEPDVWVAEVNSVGDLIWQRCCGGSAQDEGFNVFELSNSTFVVTAFTYSSNFDVTNNYGSADAWIFKITNLSEISNAIDDGMLSVYPNPATTEICINFPENGYKNISINNMLGQTVYQTNTLEKDIKFDVSNLNKGMYFIIMSNNDKKSFAKIVVE